AVKDLFDTAGIPTTCGSPRILGGNVPTRTAAAVERLEQAGGGAPRQPPQEGVGLLPPPPPPPPPAKSRGPGPPPRWVATRPGERDARDRHGGVDPAARRLVRRRRSQADMGASVARRRLPAGCVIRSCGSDHAKRRGRGARAPLHRRSRSPRPIDAATERAAC